MDPLQNVLTTLQALVQAVNALNNTLTQVFPQSTGTATSATAGSATALPALPAGYVAVTLPNGQSVLVPYYN